MTDFPARVLPTDLPRSIAEMVAYNAERMRRMNPKTDAEIAAMEAEYGPDEDGEFDDFTPYRLTEEGINEQVDATVERRGLQKVG